MVELIVWGGIQVIGGVPLRWTDGLLPTLPSVLHPGREVYSALPHTPIIM